MSPNCICHQTQVLCNCKCRQNPNIAKKQISTIRKCCQNSNFALQFFLLKTKMSLKLKYCQNANVLKMQILPTRKYCPNANITKNWKVTKTKMSQILKWHQNWNVKKLNFSKAQISPKHKWCQTQKLPKCKEIRTNMSVTGVR